ncbi:MAG: hypothetical protein JXJ22_09155 [Bacteroidales bacterium]|nr:hypothetical protein [Bacteroidales bacterium]
MTADEKYQDENLIMHYFAEKYDQFPSGKLIKTESPDFILKRSSRSAIGIELTRLKQPNSFNYLHSDRPYESLPVPFTKENLEKTIYNKEEKLPIYRKKKVEELWLIITAEIIEKSTSYNIPDKIDQWNFNSKFHKVFFFEIFSGNIFELQ